MWWKSPFDQIVEYSTNFLLNTLEGKYKAIEDPIVRRAKLEALEEVVSELEDMEME